MLRIDKLAAEKSPYDLHIISIGWVCFFKIKLFSLALYKVNEFTTIKSSYG